MSLPMPALQLKLVSSCTRCPALGTDHVPAAGAVSTDLMIVGQSPGAAEVERGAPFVGPCGDYVNGLLTELLLSRDEVYITNALKCRPPGNRAAEPRELSMCHRMWLKHELRLVQPKVLLVLGKDAFKSVLGRSPFSDRWGNGVVVRSNKRSYVISYHPSWFIRRSDLDGFLKLAPVLEQELGHWSNE